MKKRNKNFKWFYLVKELILLLIGGVVYMGIELLWRGRTHWTMGIVGGVCFVLIGLLNEIYTFEQCMEKQALYSAIIVTIVEFIAGCVINIHFGLDVWDYSNLPFNISGQVCLLFSVLWFFLAFVAIYLDDLLRNKLFREGFPEYRWFISTLKKK